MKSPVDANNNNEIDFSWDPMADHIGNSQYNESLADKRDLNEYFDFLMEVDPSKSVDVLKPDFSTEIFTL